ncbi:dephospho-CoA kinase [Thiolapillus sp.]|uniref:dephospho-CoA kinase n=1 Tax=Thiolapillus sp. TaxID=2017437 RepID=UPI003AF69806
MLKVGLTGGIASGKTEVSNHFARLGIPVIDTDKISRELVEPGKPALQQIRKQLGEQFLDTEGRLNRKQLRKHIFDNPKARKALENILHPAIRQETEHQLSALETEPHVLLVVPLLVESGLKSMVDRVLLVDAPESLQVARVCRRDSIDEKQAEKILAAQASRSERACIADDVIENSGNLQQLQQQVEKLHKFYLSIGNPSD